MGSRRPSAPASTARAMNASGSAQHTSGQNGWGTVSVTGAENLTMGAAKPRHGADGRAASRRRAYAVPRAPRCGTRRTHRRRFPALLPWYRVATTVDRSVAHPVGTPRCICSAAPPCAWRDCRAVHYDPRSRPLGVPAGHASATGVGRVDFQRGGQHDEVILPSSSRCPGWSRRWQTVEASACRHPAPVVADRLGYFVLQIEAQHRFRLGRGLQRLSYHRRHAAEVIDGIGDFEGMGELFLGVDLKPSATFMYATPVSTCE